MIPASDMVAALTATMVVLLLWAVAMVLSEWVRKR